MNIQRLTISVLLLAIVGSSARADEPIETTNPPAETNHVKRQPARVVYEQLLAEYRTGESKGLPTLELLRTWSVRMTGEAVIGLPAGTPLEEAEEIAAQAIGDHKKRMNDLRKISRQRVKAGVAEYAEVAAVEYYMVEAERLPDVFESYRRGYETGELKLKLPKVNRLPPLRPSKELVVKIDAAGRINVRGKILTLAQFEKLLQAEKPEKGTVGLVIRCDQRTKNGDVVSVIDVASEYGDSYSLRITMNTDSKQDQPEN